MWDIWSTINGSKAGRLIYTRSMEYKSMASPIILPISAL